MTTQTKTTTTSTQRHIIEEMMADFAFYQEPNLLKPEYQQFLDAGRANQNGIKKYIQLFSNVRYAWQKTLKYKSYFEHFYPQTEKIDKIEALNHHIHAYLEDMTTLKNKISLWFASKNKKNGRFRDRTGETLFIDARETFEQISRKQVTFTKEHIQKIASTVRAWRGEAGAGEYKDIAGFCKAARKEEIAKNGYVLTPGRYVGVAEEEDDGIPFKEKMDKLSGELKEYFKEGAELEKKILENLKSINY